MLLTSKRRLLKFNVGIITIMVTNDVIQRMCQRLVNIDESFSLFAHSTCHHDVSPHCPDLGEGEAKTVSGP